MTTDDDWLDAFSPEDLDDPILTRIDAAVEPPAARRRRWWPLLVAPLAVAAAAALWVATPTAPPPVAPLVSSPVVTVEVGPSLLAPRHEQVGEAASPEPETSESPSVAAPEQPRIAESPPPPSEPAPPSLEAEALSEAAEAVAAAEPEAVEPPRKRPGLQLRPGALATVEGETAVLSSGVLTYRHDATHEPGVRRVAISEPPMVARPVGTAFTASTRNGYAAVQVTEGEVWVKRVNGQAVLQLHPGDEVLVFRDGESLGWLATGGLPLDEVVDLLPRRRSRDQRSVVSLLASLRLAAREGLEDAHVPFVLEGEL